MSSKFCGWLCSLFVLAMSGCAMCSNCDDYTYGGSGGLWERLDPTFGRVGSAFTPEVGMRIDATEVEGTESELIEPGEPTPAEDPDPAPAPLEESEMEAPETSVLQDREVFAR